MPNFRVFERIVDRHLSAGDLGELILLGDYSDGAQVHSFLEAMKAREKERNGVAVFFDGIAGQPKVEYHVLHYRPYDKPPLTSWTVPAAKVKPAANRCYILPGPTKDKSLDILVPPPMSRLVAGIGRITLDNPSALEYLLKKGR